MMFSTAIAGFLLHSLMVGGRILSKQQQQTNSTFQAGQISSAFLAVLSNRAAWEKTLKDPVNAATFACLLKDATSCVSPPPNGGIFRGNDISGKAILGYNSSSTGGFSLSGVVCNDFVAPPAKGSNRCPLKLTLTWSPICPTAGSCDKTTVQIELKGTWTYNPQALHRTIAFNTENYNFRHVIPPPDVSLADGFAYVSLNLSNHVHAGWGVRSGTVVYNQVIKDKLKQYNPATGRITIQRTGLYSITASFCAGINPSSMTANAHCRITVASGPVWASTVQAVFNSQACQPSLTVTAEFAAGDQLSLNYDVYNGPAPNPVLLCANQNRLILAQIR